MLTCQKSLFDLGEGVAYLNCATLSPLSRRVVAAGQEGIQRKVRPWSIKPTDFFEPCDRLRATFARLIAAEDLLEVALLPSVSYGLAQVAANMPAMKGKNKIVLLEGQFPSNVYCWHRLARTRQWECVQVAPPLTGSQRAAAWNEALLDAIDERTALVAMGPVHWTDGTCFDLEAVKQRVHRHGAVWVLDATQFVGAHPFSVTDLGPDAVVAAGYKFLMGPYGIAFGWYGPRIQQGMPIEENWANRMHSDDFARLINYQAHYRPGAQRFNVGEQANFITVPMMQAALDQVLEWGPARIQAYCRQLVHPYLDRLRAMGVEIAPQAWHIFGLHLPSHVPPQVLKEGLEALQVVVSVRGDAVRVSPNVYNTPEDMERLVEALDHALQDVRQTTH